MVEALTPQERYEAHRREPHCMGRMPDADGVGNVGSIVVGRALRFFIKLEDQRIAAARFQVFSSPDSVAAASVLCDLLVGKTPEEAAAVSEADLCAELGGLPRFDLPVVSWPLIALRLALAAATQAAPPLVEDRQIDQVVCRCLGVTEATLRETIAELEAPDLAALMEATAAGTACGSCQRDLLALLEESSKPATQAIPGGRGRGRVALLKRIAEVAEPVLAEAGSDGRLELWNLDGVTVQIRCSGALADPAHTRRGQLLDRLERTLRDEVDPTLTVHAE